MSDDRSDAPRAVTYTYEHSGRLISITDAAGEVSVKSDSDGGDGGDAPPPYRFEHDPTARVFRLTAPDGTVETFRDNPTRYLCLEPDPESGAMRPVMKRGRPVYLYLAREDREAR